MARPYSVDLRERVVRAVAAGASRRATAAKFEVSVSFVIKLMQRWLRRGTVQPDRIGGWKRSTLAAHAERVRALVAVRDKPGFRTGSGHRAALPRRKLRRRVRLGRTERARGGT
jgi:transposase